MGQESIETLRNLVGEDTTDDLLLCMQETSKQELLEFRQSLEVLLQCLKHNFNEKSSMSV